MEIKIGKKRLKQIEGSDCDNIIFIDRDTKKKETGINSDIKPID